MAAGATSSRGRPRGAAISSGRTRSFSACIVACTMLIGFDEPTLLESTAWIPAHSSTARTGPPAMTPGGGGAGDAGHGVEVLLGLLDALGDRRGPLLGLAVADADLAVAVAHDHEGGEAEAPTTLDDLGHAVDGDDALDVVA